jgi:hypothetical protein
MDLQDDAQALVSWQDGRYVVKGKRVEKPFEKVLAAPIIKIEVDPSGRSKGTSVTMGARRLTTETIFSSGSLP